MELAGQRVKIRLSRQGLSAVRSILRAKVGLKRAFRAFVLDNDGGGVWIVNRRLPDEQLDILLIKWEHIEALGFETRLVEPEEKLRIGFKR